MAAKSKTDEQTLSPKAQGTALFLEFTRSTGTQQMIIVSESEVEGQTRPPMLLIRQITKEAKRRPWDVRVSSIVTEKDPAARAAKYLEFYSKWLTVSINGGNWVRKGDPIGVEVSAQDYVELGEGKAPQAMIQRIAAISKLREDEEASA